MSANLDKGIINKNETIRKNFTNNIYKYDSKIIIILCINKEKITVNVTKIRNIVHTYGTYSYEAKGTVS